MATRLMSVVPMSGETLTPDGDPGRSRINPGWVAVRPVPTGAQRVPSGLFTLDARRPSALRAAAA